MGRATAQWTVPESLTMRGQAMSEDGTEIDGFREAKCINYAIDLYLGSDYRSAVVERALNWRKNASPEAQKSLRSAINTSNLSVQGFRNTRAYKAPTGRLLSPTIEHMSSSNGLSAAILMVWIESHDSLRMDVIEYHKQHDLPIQEDISGSQFPGTWEFDTWDLETRAFVKRNDNHSADDVALMLCCVSGNMPLPPPDDLDDEAILPEGSMFPHWIEYLKQLPPDAPEWQEAEDFIGQFREISQAKEREAEQALAAALAEAIAYVGDNFLDDLRYLEADIDAWSATDTSNLADISKTLQIVEQLGAVLFEYCTVRLQAPTRSEEDARRAKRSELEPRILGLIDQIGRHMAGDWNPDDDPSPLKPETGDSAEGGAADGVAGDISESVIQKEPENSGTASATGQSSEIDYTLVQAENDLLKSKLREADQEVESLKSNVQEMQDEFQQEYKDLRDKVAASQWWRKHWHEMYIAGLESRSNADGVAEKAPADIRSVKDAVELAERKYSDSLWVELVPNSRKEMRRLEFNSPDSVFTALEWLATVYHKHKSDTSYRVLLGESCKADCGWTYAGGNNATTMGENAEDYEVTVDGVKYQLAKHLKKGTDSNMIRIGFEWDADLKVVVVGFIGRHQRM